MVSDYSKYLNTKLYLIEGISLKGMLAGDERMKEIHDICIASHTAIEKLMEEKCKK